MKEFIEIYKEHKKEIEDFLIETTKNSGLINLPKTDERTKKLFKVFPSLELVYYISQETYAQTSSNFYRTNEDKKHFGKDRAYLVSKVHLDGNDIAISSPYISSATGSTCITMLYKLDNNEILLLDFELVKLLERLGLVEINFEFNTISKLFYTLTGFTMIALSLFIVGYAMFEFLYSFLFKMDLSIDTVFKPIIALTLGLAIFDLAKTVLEQEVFFKSYSKNPKIELQVFTKFLITIIIALSIEALMVVFKIAMENYHEMINAFYLIAGISIIILALGAFIFLTKRKPS